MQLSDWLDEATPDRREVQICFDRRLVSALDKAKEQLKAVTDEKMLGKTATQAELEAKIAEAEEAVRAKTRTLVFEGMGWGRWRDMLAKHPPAPEQAETFEKAVSLLFMPHAIENIGYNAETFVPAAIAASCVEPGMFDAEARKLLDKAPPGVIERIWLAVLEVNLAGAMDPFVVPVSEDNSDGAKASVRK